MDIVPRLSNRLTSLTLRSLPPGKHLDGAGLYLIKPDGETGRWMLRYRQFGRRRDMGLGGWPKVGLGDARRTAETARRLISDGLDPISARRLKHQAKQHLLRDIAKDCFDSRKAELRGEGVAGRWYSAIELHLLPKLGSTPVVSINQVVIKDVLASLWKEKPAEATDHPTAEQLHARARQTDPSISRAAVFRALTAFANAGLATVLDTGRGVFRYEDATIGPHDHLADRDTGELNNITSSELDAAVERTASSLGYRVTGRRLIIWAQRIEARPDEEFLRNYRDLRRPPAAQRYRNSQRSLSSRSNWKPRP